MSWLFRRGIFKPLLAWIVILAAVGALAAVGFIYSGLFNVAATVEDSALLKWVLVGTREASIQSRAKAIQAPSPGGAEQLDNGFRLFREECAMCHTPPGGIETMMATGLNPEAPPLAELVEDMTDAELFWVTKNGIRFTGMPAWGPSHSDQDSWDVVAFMRASVDMPAEEYAAMDKRIPPGPPMHGHPGN